MLLELDVEVVRAGSVLLDRDHDPVAEALRLVRVELDVDLRDDVVLLVEDEDDVGLVVDRRRAAEVVVPQSGGLQPLLVGRDDGDRRELLGQREADASRRASALRTCVSQRSQEATTRSAA